MVSAIAGNNLKVIMKKCPGFRKPDISAGFEYSQ